MCVWLAQSGGVDPALAPFSTFYAFATALSVGSSVPLLLVPIVHIGRRFFILITFLSIVFVALATAASRLVLNYYYLAFAALLIFYNVLLPAEIGVDVSARRAAREGGARPGLRRLAQTLLVAALTCGVLGLVGDATSHPPVAGLGSGQTAILALTFLSSSLVVGGALTAMILGHWYLVARNLSFVPLERATWLLLGALVVRIGVALWAVWAQASEWQTLAARAGTVSFLIQPGIFLLARAIFGLLAPAALGWMAWRCVALKANQSATGILYVVVAFVLIGEIIAKYFLSRGLVI